MTWFLSVRLNDDERRLLIRSLVVAKIGSDDERIKLARKIENNSHFQLTLDDA